jgi:Mg2+-importing ATPase
MISSVTLTQGALRMARDQVIVKHLPAIQDFGSIDVLCSDKTAHSLPGRCNSNVPWIPPVRLRRGR